MKWASMPRRGTINRGGWALTLVGAALVGLVTAVNLYLAARSAGLIAQGVPAVDWDQVVEAGRRVYDGDLYAVSATYAFPYSPLLAYVAGPLSWLGVLGWRALHVLAALALPSWPMRLVTLAAWPFWFDLETGNFLVFIVLAASWAIRGSGVGTGAYLALTLLIPRPLMIPVAVWLLWKRPAWRLRFVAMTGIAALAVLASGWGDEWVGFLVSIGAQFESPNNLGPTRLIGALWLVVAVPLAAWLTWKGRLGFASVALSYPYVLPYYLLMLVLELSPRSEVPGPAQSARSASARAPSTVTAS
jgi:hypothetical protein